jgi:hypothetical protein
LKIALATDLHANIQTHGVQGHLLFGYRTKRIKRRRRHESWGWRKSFVCDTRGHLPATVGRRPIDPRTYTRDGTTTIRKEETRLEERSHYYNSGGSEHLLCLYHEKRNEKDVRTVKGIFAFLSNGIL